MKERPILFNDEMIRAILEGRKTQTRRILKDQPVFGDVQGIFHCWQFPCKNGRLLYPNAKDQIISTCPYGQVGDRLWVRECFADQAGGTRKHPGDHLLYRASGDVLVDGPWTPSIHMPRWASRITLEITNVRVERLRDISEADAFSEGCDSSKTDAAIAVGWFEKPLRAFQRVWESVYGPESWNSNPWVWVIEFKRVLP